MATTDYERKAIADANTAQIEGREISVLSAVFKLIAERARDYEAVAVIINSRREEIEVGYIKAWLEQFGIAERWDRGQEEAVREARS